MSYILDEESAHCRQESCARMCETRVAISLECLITCSVLLLVVKELIIGGIWEPRKHDA